MNIFTKFIEQLIKFLWGVKPPVIVPDSTTPPPPVKPPEPKYLWDTKENARHSVRVICDEEGLSTEMKNILTACVTVESNFNPKAVHANIGPKGTVTSTDYGIVQVNDYFHIGSGKDFPSVEFVLNNPEICTRWMAKLFKQGHQNLWSSFVNGAYKMYL